MAWNRIEELLDQYTEVRDDYEGGLPARAVMKLDTRLSSIEVRLAARTAEEKEDQFHSEIDEARDHINKSEFQMAKLLLQRIQSRNETALKTRHKFRILTNLAAVAIGEDDWQRAAELYLEAKVHQPDDEMAQSNAALAYQILGDREHAFALASKLRDVYPNSARIFGILVRNAPDTMTLDEVQSYVPPHVAIKGEAALALAQRAMDANDFATGEKFARAATTSHPKWSVPWLALGAVIVDDETSRAWETYGFDQCHCDKTRLAEAEAAFTTALACAKVEKSNQRIVAALLNRSRVKGICSREAEGHMDIEEAYRIAPDDPDVLMASSQPLRLQGDAKGAIEVLRRVPVGSMPHHGQMMLAMLLIERGNPSDYREVAKICSGLARLPEGMKADFREHVVEVALDALAKDSRIQDGYALLDELPKNTVSQIGIKTLRAKLYRLEDKQELAALTTDETLKEVSETTSPHDLRRLAVLLSALGRHKDALVLWQRVTVPSVLSGDPQSARVRESAWTARYNARHFPSLERCGCH